MKTFRLDARTLLFARRSVCILTLLTSLAFGVYVIFSGLLPVKLLVATFTAVVILNGLVLTLIMYLKSKKANVVGLILAALIVTMNIGGVYAISNSLHLLSRVTSNASVKKKDIDSTKPFNVYISGIDTYGDIDTVSRSDVNIVATINTSTKHAVLTTIPRDSYVPIAGGGNGQYDKLTHAGNYGVEASMQTVSNLLDSDITTYIRINFSSFMKIIDSIGGITVDNPVTFKTDDGQVFQQGRIFLNAEDALKFSRERHNLQGGDNDRGKNQERVIMAVLEKSMEPRVIYHYQSILDVLGGSVQTNISRKSMTALINQQIDSSDHWTVESTSISGYGQTGGLPSYAMPGSQLYMFVLDQASLEQTKERIRTTLNS